MAETNLSLSLQEKSSTESFFIVDEADTWASVQ